MLQPGTSLGPYEILSPLGAGGMGEVYRARDTRLGRDVAIKVLPARLVSSAAARQRFQREARAVAALKHPHISVVHDVGEVDGASYFVTELLDGETLQTRLTRGAMDLRAVVDSGIALADALDVAHGAGLVHRDIKPANIFLTAHGPKILDFGLSKEGSAAVFDAPDRPTRTGDAFVTEAGMALGTLPYMSPEQLRGEALDARSDLFAGPRVVRDGHRAAGLFAELECRDRRGDPQGRSRCAAADPPGATCLAGRDRLEDAGKGARRPLSDRGGAPRRSQEAEATA